MSQLPCDVDAPTEALTHDHAWRRVGSKADPSWLEGEYRCDLCHASWSL